MRDEAAVQAAAPILQKMIEQSKADALRSGVQPIPPEIRKNLSGYVSESIMNAARFRVKGGGDLSLQAGAVRYGEQAAITFDNVIVFRFQGDALYNPVLWAHELKHVEQYQKWGVKDFAIRYVRDFKSVEREAYEFDTKYAAWVASNSRSSTPAGFNAPNSKFSNQRQSSVCSTLYGRCELSGVSGAVGASCWCALPGGAAIGALVSPEAGASAPQQAANMPIATGMTLTCRYTNGPRRNQVENFEGRALPIRIGTGCTDGVSSFGVGVPDSTSDASTSSSDLDSGMSLTCQYTSGPRAGQTQTFAIGSARPAPIGGNCTDGWGSWGYAR